MTRCSVCKAEPQPCSNRDGRQAAFHDHEYDEWWCQPCARGYGDELGSQAYPVKLDGGPTET